MGEIIYKSENEFLKHNLVKNEWGHVEEVIHLEKFYVKSFNTKNDICDFCGFCYNSIPAFCRVQTNVNYKLNYSYLERLHEKSSVLVADNKEIPYNHICRKVAWGACAFFFYTKRIDERGRSRYEWRRNEYSLAECRQIYFNICYEVYKEQNLDDYNYYLKSIKDINGFKSEFAKHHIEYEKQLMNRTYATDIFAEYETVYHIKDEVEGYLDWVHSKYLIKPQTETTEDVIKYPHPVLMKLFADQEYVYDLFLERCRGKANIDVVNEVIAVSLCFEKDVRVLLNKKGFGLNNLRQALIECGLTVAKRQGFEARLNEAASLNANRLKLVEKAKTEYQKVLNLHRSK